MANYMTREELFKKLDDSGDSIQSLKEIRGACSPGFSAILKQKIKERLTADGWEKRNVSYFTWRKFGNISVNSLGTFHIEDKTNSFGPAGTYDYYVNSKEGKRGEKLEIWIKPKQV